MGENGPPGVEPAPEGGIPRIVARPGDDERIRSRAFDFWFLNGGPECMFSVVSAHFRLSYETIRVWAERDGWREKWAASIDYSDREKEASSEYRVSAVIDRDKIKQFHVHLLGAMMSLVQKGGLEASIKIVRDPDGTERVIRSEIKPAIRTSVTDIIKVLDRVEGFVRQEEAVHGPVKNAVIISRRDIDRVRDLDSSQLRNLRAAAREFLAGLQVAPPVPEPVPDPVPEPEVKPEPGSPPSSDSGGLAS